MSRDWIDGKPGFLRAMEEDARGLSVIHGVDQAVALDAALLVLGHFAGNVARDSGGRAMRLARDFILVTTAPRMPEWFGHYTGCLARAGEAAATCCSLVQVCHSAEEIRRMREDMRHLGQFGNMFAGDVRMLRWNLARIRMSAPVRYMLGPRDGGILPRQGLRASVALVLDGSRHLGVLRDAARRQPHRAILRAIGKPPPATRLSVLGWCEWPALAAPTGAKGGGSPLSCLPGSPLFLPTAGACGPPPWGNRGTPPARGIIPGFEETFDELLRCRFLGEARRFTPGPEVRGRLEQALAAEKAAVEGCPHVIRPWARPVVGLSGSMAALFHLLGAARGEPAETGPLTGLALEVAGRVRKRSLDWLRRALAAEAAAGLLPLDQAVYRRLFARGPTRARDLCRAFHKLRRAELDEAVTRLRGAGLVAVDDGMITVVADAATVPGQAAK